MSRITCDICGTTYADTAPCCPICGNTRDYDDGVTMEELLGEEEDYMVADSGRKREIFDFDEVNSESYQDSQETYTAEDEEEEEAGPSTWVIILLTVLITALLAAAAFIFIRYYLPSRQEAPAASTAAAVQTQPAPVEATELSIPCVDLVMSSGASAQLSAPGQHFLLHVQAKPEDTTDRIIYTSGNEAIATVTEDGRITAVSEGETIIYIACGLRTLECPVVVKYVEDTIPPTIDITPPAPITAEDVDPDETLAQTQPAAGAEDTAANSAVRTDVVLKLVRTDIQLAAYRGTTLELDCDLDPEDIEWSSEHPYIASVNEKGFVQSNGPGTTVITAKYGDQVVECIVRCIIM